jgi:hypothetical protein
MRPVPAHPSTPSATRYRSCPALCGPRTARSTSRRSRSAGPAGTSTSDCRTRGTTSRPCGSRLRMSADLGPAVTHCRHRQPVSRPQPGGTLTSRPQDRQASRIGARYDGVAGGAGRPGPEKPTAWHSAHRHRPRAGSRSRCGLYRSPSLDQVAHLLISEDRRGELATATAGYEHLARLVDPDLLDRRVASGTRPGC